MAKIIVNSAAIELNEGGDLELFLKIIRTAKDSIYDAIRKEKNIAHLEVSELGSAADMCESLSNV